MLAGGRQNVHSGVRGHVQAAFRIDGHPVPTGIARERAELAPVGCRSVGLDVEHADVLAWGVVDVEQGLVRGEAEAGGVLEVVDQEGEAPLLALR